MPYESSSPVRLRPERFFDGLDRQAAVDDDLALVDVLEEDRLFVVLVVDLANDLFQDVLDGDHPGGAAVLVGDDGDVDAVAAQLGQQIVQPLRLRNDVRRADEPLDR